MAVQNAINNLLATTSLTGFIQAANFPALTGDVTTVAGFLATTIANDAVTTVKVLNSNITYAKIQNVAAASLLGNPTGSPAAPSEITLGTGLSFTGAVLNATSTFSPMPTVTVTGTSQAAAVNTAYTANNAALVTITLPATAAVGDEIRVMGLGAGGWLLAQNASQVIHFGNTDTTVGVAGSIASKHRYDTLMIKCVIANTTFDVVASQGNFDVD
jgi:hypothetical protein